jgi:hypothetical protein
MFLIDSTGTVTPVTTDAPANFSPGHILIALVTAEEGDQSPATVSHPRQTDYECQSPS